MIDLRARLYRRHLAYQACFLDEKGNLTDAGKIVLDDLQKFGGVLTGLTVVSPIQRVTDVPATMQRVGRADVFNRIWRYLRLPAHKLFDQVEGSDNE